MFVLHARFTENIFKDKDSPHFNGTVQKLMFNHKIMLSCSKNV